MLEKYFKAFVWRKYSWLLIVLSFLSCAFIKYLSVHLFKGFSSSETIHHIFFFLGSIFPYVLYAFVLANVLAKRLVEPLNFKKCFGVVGSSLFPISLAHALSNYYLFTYYPFLGDVLAVGLVTVGLQIIFHIKLKNALGFAFTTYLGLFILSISIYGF